MDAVVPRSPVKSTLMQLLRLHAKGGPPWLKLHTPAEKVALARHAGRPGTADYIKALFTDFFEQKGDRLCGEDAGILGGIAMFHGRPVTVIGHRKGRNLEENTRCNFGMPSPEGWRSSG